MLTNNPSVGLVVWFQRQFLQRTGNWIREKDVPALRQMLEGRLRAHGFAAPEIYQQFLEADGGDARREWTFLTETLKNGESFFFRDAAQMALLRETILPELIAKNADRRLLRIWSAGCATGEEPYSLAILLFELLPEPDAWNLQIVGTDLSEESVKKARAGRYGAWSFRMMDASLLLRYFREERDCFCIDSRIQRWVTFRQGNLIHDDFPGTGSGFPAMDLILCRNVFTSFEPQGIATVVEKFARTLAPGGYLMTGHGELQQLDPGALRVVHFPESVLYQREDATVLIP